jgi:hypothetical protein
MQRLTRANREYIRKSVELYSAMKKATTEEEFQRPLAQHDALTDAAGFHRFACRTLQVMRDGVHEEGGGIMSGLPKQTTNT